MTQWRVAIAQPCVVHPDEHAFARLPALDHTPVMHEELAALTVAALGIALSPIPILVMVGLLSASGPGSSAIAFASGEAVAVGALLLATVFLFDPGGERGSLGSLETGLALAVGVLLLALLVAHLRRPRRPRGWTSLSLFERVGPRAAFAGGLGMVLVNPKNLALTLAGAAAILELTSSTGARVATLVTFTCAAVSLLALLVAASAAFPGRASAVLGRGRALVLEHERVVVTVLLAALGGFFLARGLVDVAV